MQSDVFTLRCVQCAKLETFTSDEVAQRLRKLGFLRRVDDQTASLLEELAVAAVESGRWGPCESCGSLDLVRVDSADNLDDDWGDARVCEDCGKVIPAERIEAFPKTKLCLACQQKVEKGEASGEHEYCPRCGNIMQLRREPGGTNFRMHCPACRKTF